MVGTLVAATSNPETAPMPMTINPYDLTVGLKNAVEVWSQYMTRQREKSWFNRHFPLFIFSVVTCSTSSLKAKCRSSMNIPAGSCPTAHGNGGFTNSSRQRKIVQSRNAAIRWPGLHIKGSFVVTSIFAA